MLGHLRANLLLLALTLLLCSVIYPLALWIVGQTLFESKAQGSLIYEGGKAVGSRLIGQPFSGEEYFQPRPSATTPSYNAAASGASNYGASNYLLRDRVARQLGPIVKYAGGPRKGKEVAPDIETWFREDRFRGKVGIVAQWAEAHPTLASNWVKADPLNTAYVEAWSKDHPAEVAAWVKENPGTPEPKPEDLAVAFFVSYAKAHPRTFPAIIEKKNADSKTEKNVEPVTKGVDIQATFFDLWRQEHPTAELEPVPADLVMASASGLDPHITLKNAFFQLERVAGKWAEKTKRSPAQLRGEIEALLRERAEAPLGGLVGGDLINVLEVNLLLRQRYGG
jgi:K+-transporting ATPase ATPase C chain